MKKIILSLGLGVTTLGSINDGTIAMSEETKSGNEAPVGNIDSIESLQKIVDVGYRVPLFAAIKNCDLEGVKVLVHDDVNKKNCYDRAPIE